MFQSNAHGISEPEAQFKTFVCWLDIRLIFKSEEFCDVMVVPEWKDAVAPLAYLLCVAHTVLQADTVLLPQTNICSDTNVSDRRSQLPILAEEIETPMTGSRQHALWNQVEKAAQGPEHTERKTRANNVWTSLNISKPARARGPLARPQRKASQQTNTAMCAESKYNMKSKGNITFISEKDADMTWNITVDSSCHLVLQVQQLYFPKAENQSLSFNFTTKFSTTSHVKHYSSSVLFPLPPVFIRASTVQVRITTSQPRSRVSITYAAYLSSVLPPETEGGKYNCSPPYTVPAVLKCDMVEQCLGGEDEKECPYKSKSCEANWLPVGFHCLLFRFPTRGLSITTAEDECQNVYGAELAALQDATCTKLAARVLLLHGFTEAAVGLKRVRTKDPHLQRMYRFLWQWTRDNVVMFNSLHRSIQDLYYECATIHVSWTVSLKAADCFSVLRAHICDKNNKPFLSKGIILPALTSNIAWKMLLTECADGTSVHVFHTCPTTEHRSSLPMFTCCDGRQVHYAVTCDGIDDCLDGCDENFCKALTTSTIVQNANLMCLRQFQLVLKTDRCDGKDDCHDFTDEKNCESCPKDFMRCRELGCLYREHLHFLNDSFNLKRLCITELTNKTQAKPESTISKLFSSFIIELDGFGMVKRVRLRPGENCPSTHVQCIDGLCIPSYLVNNNEKDCLFGEDEITTEEGVETPGYYRCYKSDVRLHPSYFCDGMYQCPLKDDEMYCDDFCPSYCKCEGFAFTCSKVVDSEKFVAVRYLDLSWSLVRGNLSSLCKLPLVQYLNLSHCGLSFISLPFLPLLAVLDLSSNNLTSVTNIGLKRVPRLKYLLLSNNPILPKIDATFAEFLQSSRMPSLLILQLANASITAIEADAFMPFAKLNILNLRENKIENFNERSFKGLESLRILETDDRRLCCLFELTYSRTQFTCLANDRKIWKCDYLMETSFLRFSIWLLSLVTIVSNAVALVYRVRMQGSKGFLTFQVLVCNLCVADFLMGVYLLVIGSADAALNGHDMLRHRKWTQSAACKAAGFLSLVSSEMSAFVICTISVDRALVLNFPLHNQFHLKAKTAQKICYFLWFTSVILALLPVILGGSESRNPNGICAFFPITTEDFARNNYSSQFFIVLNTILLVVIIFSQFFVIYTILRSASRTNRCSKQVQQDLTASRRLLLIVFVNFCCWFPISVSGLLLWAGRPLPSDLSVWFAIFVLPMNSAVDPFLYTLNTVIDRWNQRRLEEEISRTQSRLRAQLFSWPMTTVIQLLHDCKSARSRLLVASRRNNEYFNSGIGVYDDFSELQDYRRFSHNRRKISKFHNFAEDEIHCHSITEFQNRSLSISTHDNSIYLGFEEAENGYSPGSAASQCNYWVNLAAPGNQNSPRDAEGKKCERLDLSPIESVSNFEYLSVSSPESCNYPGLETPQSLISSNIAMSDNKHCTSLISPNAQDSPVLTVSEDNN